MDCATRLLSGATWINYIFVLNIIAVMCLIAIAGRIRRTEGRI
jgi:hypothetical protein